LLGNQITPVPVTLDGKRHTARIDLEAVAQHLRPGAAVSLQIVATTPVFAAPRLGGTIDVGRTTVRLPVAEGLTPVSPTG